MSFRLKRFFGDLIGLAILIQMILFLVNCGNLKAGYAAVTAVAAARDLTSSTLNAVCRPKMLECEKAHGAKTEGFKTCVAKCKKALKTWATYLVPSIQSGLILTKAGLDAARARKDLGFDWWATLKPVACALTEAVLVWEPLIGKTRAAAILGALSLGKGALCK